MAQEKVRIAWNKEIKPSYMHLGLEGQVISSKAMAGQFVMLKTDDRLDPLLRRPFSIHQVIKKEGKAVGIEILYKVVGTVTKRLSTMKEGETIDLVGPLGKGFQIAQENKKVFIAAGGIGVAPFVYLASKLIEEKINPELCNVFIGGRTEDDVLAKEIFETMGMKVHQATDDGSLGHKGLITDLIEAEIEKDVPDIIYACGPHPMLKAVADIAEKSRINCQVSIEILMACGMGACLGCAVKKKKESDKYLHVCIDGPVFNTNELSL